MCICILYIYMHIYLCITYMYIYIYIYMYMCIYIHIYMCVCIYMYTYIRLTDHFFFIKNIEGFGKQIVQGTKDRTVYLVLSVSVKLRFQHPRTKDRKRLASQRARLMEMLATVVGSQSPTQTTAKLSTSASLPVARLRAVKTSFSMRCWSNCTCRTSCRETL